MTKQRRLWLALALLALAFLPGTALLLQLAYRGLHRSFGVVVDLVSIAVVLFLIAAFFAPLEALGWWAGWFGEEMAPPRVMGQLAAPLDESRPVRRWVVYLDGIGQVSQEALPEGEDFLRRLADRLGDDIAIVRGIMPYSVNNRPITEGGWLAAFWRWVDWLRLKNPRALLGVIINLRNVTVVAVSADRRYGPIYNTGIATVITDSLLANGYRPGSGTPITLLGFSGGGQISLGALPHLRRRLEAPVEVISLGGVFAGSNRFLQAEHLFHLVGTRDHVERIGPVAFPGRWRCMPLSYWNRALRRGKVTVLSLGPVGHELPGGILDADYILPDGRSAMEQTVDLVTAILTDQLPFHRPPPVTSNYTRFRANPWHRLQAARDSQPLPSSAMRPMDDWIGRLILPKAATLADVATTASTCLGDFEVDLELFAAPLAWRHLVGRTLRLRWHEPALRPLVRDVYFSDEALEAVREGGVHPLRLDHRRGVTPLESLAGARPEDDVLVRLPEPVEVLEGLDGVRLRITSEPVQTTGVALALVRYEKPLDGSWWLARPFDPQAGRFAEPSLRLRLPPPMANGEGIVPSTSEGLERGALNGTGWYVGGVPDGEGGFVVQTMVPRAQLRFAPQRVIIGWRPAWRYVKREAWRAPKAGSFTSVLVSGRRPPADRLLEEWRCGDRLLVMHVYGGIGGQQREKALRSGLCVGHFAYGVAELIQEPLAGELSLDLRYHQVYAHNPEGIVAGAQDIWRYLGDRQWGWLGSRPVADILVRFPPFTGTYHFGDRSGSPLEAFARQLEGMTARYRIGDGTGGTFVGAANNCAQDSNQALFAALSAMQAQLRAMDPAALLDWRRRHPDQAHRLSELLHLETSLRRALLPFGGLRADWLQQEFVLGTSPQEQPIDNLLRGLGSWRTILPRQACETVLRVFLSHGASALVVRTNQLGGDHPQIEPVAPFTL